MISSRDALKTYLFSIIWHEAKPRTSPLFTEVHFLVHEVSFGRTPCSTFELGRDFFTKNHDVLFFSMTILPFSTMMSSTYITLTSSVRHDVLTKKV